jgi:hypothetical protein
MSDAQKKEHYPELEPRVLTEFDLCGGSDDSFFANMVLPQSVNDTPVKPASTTPVDASTKSNVSSQEPEQLAPFTLICRLVDLVLLRRRRRIILHLKQNCGCYQAV